MLLNIFLLAIGLWAVWTGIKVCDQVYGIALALTGLIVVVWSFMVASLWLQISVEILLISFGHFFYKSYAKEIFLRRRTFLRASEMVCPEAVAISLAKTRR